MGKGNEESSRFSTVLCSTGALIESLACAVVPFVYIRICALATTKQETFGVKGTPSKRKCEIQLN